MSFRFVYYHIILYKGPRGLFTTTHLIFTSPRGQKFYTQHAIIFSPRGQKLVFHEKTSKFHFSKKPLYLRILEDRKTCFLNQKAQNVFFSPVPGDCESASFGKFSGISVFGDPPGCSNFGDTTFVLEIFDVTPTPVGDAAEARGFGGNSPRRVGLGFWSLRILADDSLNNTT